MRRVLAIPPKRHQRGLPGDRDHTADRGNHRHASFGVDRSEDHRCSSLLSEVGRLLSAPTAAADRMDTAPRDGIEQADQLDLSAVHRSVPSSSATLPPRIIREKGQEVRPTWRPQSAEWDHEDGWQAVIVGDGSSGDVCGLGTCLTKCSQDMLSDFRVGGR